MHPYRHIKLTECPDIYDIIREGRRSAVGKIRRGQQFFYWSRRVTTTGRVLKIKHNDRGYCRPRHKRSARRYLKRLNRVLDAQFETLAEKD